MEKHESNDYNVYEGIFADIFSAILRFFHPFSKETQGALFTVL